MLLFLLACDTQTDTGKQPVDTETVSQGDDGDLDGWTADEGDCDEEDPDVFPGATELCNGVDDNCDGRVDEGLLTTFFADVDGDGAGTAEHATEACSAEAGYVENDNDCDDNDAGVHPGADERCNGVDDDCDGEADEGVRTLVWADQDGDGYGDPDNVDESCDPGPGWVDNDDDCDDLDPTINPLGVEVCNGLDDDCDGAEDEDASGASTWYQDRDGDEHGAGGELAACERPDGWAATDDDCDDLDATAFPGATEVCDSVDNNCDGTVDEEIDLDLDGVTGCAGDCDDNDATVFPGAIETCDDQDEDCDGTVDESPSDPDLWYADADGDGYGSGASVAACDAPAGFVGVAGDCDDALYSVNPAAIEVCDERDDDCDGEVDEGFDADGDGWAECADDCDDGDAEVHPGAAESCNGVDDDCDGGVDEGASDPTIWYLDADADGHGDPADTLSACDAPAGYVDVGDDCDDADPDQFPGNVEVCDGADENCDGYADDGGVCPCDVDWNDGGTYMFCDGPTDGVTARAECIAYNYHLVRVDDAAEDAWLRSTAPTYGSGDWWIGLTDELFEGLFGWVWGADTVPYTNWASGEPNDIDGEDCVSLTYAGLNWVDQDCSVTTTFICEAD